MGQGAPPAIRGDSPEPSHLAIASGTLMTSRQAESVSVCLAGCVGALGGDPPPVRSSSSEMVTVGSVSPDCMECTGRIVFSTW